MFTCLIFELLFLSHAVSLQHDSCVAPMAVTICDCFCDVFID